MFECRRLEARNADGRLKVAGAEWTETKEWLETLMFALTLISIMAGVIVLLLVTAFVQAKLVSIGVGIVLLAMPFWLVDRNIKGTRRQLLFGRDGTIRAPLGFAMGYAGSKSIGGTLDDISSIEATPVLSERSGSIHTHAVALHKQDGDTVYVAKHLTPDQARKVARQLNLALAAMRAELGADMQARTMAAPPRRASSSRPTGPSAPSRKAALID